MLTDRLETGETGNRILKTVGVSSPTTTTTKFAYDLNGNAWLDYTGTSTLVARHIFAGGVDQLIAKIDASGVVNWYATDRLGTVRDILSSTGSLLVHADYSSFGQLTYQSTTGILDRFGFQGRETDSETGLGYFRARYVSFDTGRFLSQDPKGFGAGDPNLYRYVGNMPTNATDPSGMSAWDLAGVWGRSVVTANPIGLVVRLSIDADGIAADFNTATAALNDFAEWATPTPEHVLAARREQFRIRQQRERLEIAGNLPARLEGPAPGNLPIDDWHHRIHNDDLQRQQIGEAIGIRVGVAPAEAPWYLRWFGTAGQGEQILHATMPFAYARGMPPTTMGQPGTLIETGLPALYRPRHTVGFRNAVEGAAGRTADGRFIDAETGLPIDGEYHIGHVYGREQWRLETEAWTMPQADFAAWLRSNTQWFQIQSGPSNVGHRYEMRAE